MIGVLAFLGLVLVGSVSSKELISTYRSPRSLLLGGAYTAAADDSSTLFHNPAILGRSRGLGLYPVNPALSVSNILDDQDRFEDLPTGPAGFADRLMNFPGHVGGSIAPGFKMFTFGLSLIADLNANLLLLNRTHPILDVDYKLDRGFALGFGIPLGGSGLKEKSGSRFSLGIGGKYIKREGLTKVFSLTGTDALDAINTDDDEDFRDIIKRLGLQEDGAWGYDVGFDYVARAGSLEFAAGLSVLDIADTKFEGNEDDNLDHIRDQEMSVNFGISLKQDVTLLFYQVVADVQNINQDIDFGRKLHAGVEAGLPVLSVFAGYNGGYFSYGAGVNLFLFKIYAGFYSVEVGNAFKEFESDRLLVQVSLLDVGFEI